ncbi:MAG: hypothetical protein ABL936_00090 [Aestuariivirga sp.]
MFSNFIYKSINLVDIQLDKRNPRIVTPKLLSSQEAIIAYLFEYEGLEKFIKKIASEGKNIGAERPYVIKLGHTYTVVEGNTRNAAYKILSGLASCPKEYQASIPHVSEKLQQQLLMVDCSVAPDRDALLPIMVGAHFGLGDKSKWGYLGSRKAVYDEWKSGRNISELAKAFNCTQGEIRDYILEYLVYLEALGSNWTKEEKDSLLNPAVKFNPPIRFLETGGHKKQVGISFDTTNLKIVFENADSKKKFKHLIKKLVILPEKNLGATASYSEVFKDYGGKSADGKTQDGGKVEDPSVDDTGAKSKNGKNNAKDGPNVIKLKPDALFAYKAKKNNALLVQLMKEASDINCAKLPAAGTFLLRNIVEVILKEIIHEQGANPAKKQHDLEMCINVCLGNAVKLGHDDNKILKEFKNSHLTHLNLGAHGSVTPNKTRLMMVRDCIDQFVKRHI